jgi:cellulose synthase (UDP-forming)
MFDLLNPEAATDTRRAGRVRRAVTAILALVVTVFIVVLPLGWREQVVVSFGLVVVCIWLNHRSRDHYTTVIMICLSVLATTRYAIFRLQQSFEGLMTQGRIRHLDTICVALVLGAELYAFLTLYLGYFQTIRPLRRRPAPLPDDDREWPKVDVYVPTYNEPLQVVRPTVLAALNMDWPADRFNVYVLDDGRREEFRDFANEVGAGYIIREKHDHAKAGNINHALTKTTGDFIAIFDSDHIPTRSFLQITMGWFLKDRKLGMMQTPHHFYSPDPFERNLQEFRKIPNEGELFYGIVQDGNDLWNATFFCGSCAVLRRTALEEIGGVAVETVTEDAHTALRLQVREWNTAYINIPQAAGLATESLSGHIGQRIRWARGMVQILRLDNPLFKRTLSLPQRLCYFNAMAHFLYALPRLIFLVAPLMYLLFGLVNIYGYWVAILAYAAPHIMLSSLTNSRIQGQHRFSFWNEVYEAVLAPYILLPTMLGTFNVTAKGGLVPRSYFDSRIARPFLILLTLNVLGVVFAFPRYFWLDHDHPGTVLMNVFWTFYNIVILAVAASTAFEKQQLRAHVRVQVQIACTMVRPNGMIVTGTTYDLSSGGAAVEIPPSMQLAAGEKLNFYFSSKPEGCIFQPVVVGQEGNKLRLNFGEITLEQEEVLTRVLYSRANSWINWNDSRGVDRPLRTYAHLVRLAFQGLKNIFFGLVLSKFRAPKSDIPAKKEKFGLLRKPIFFLLLIVLALYLLVVLRARAMDAKPLSSKSSVKTSAAASGGIEFKESYDFSTLGQNKAISLRGPDSRYLLYFSVPITKVVSTASLQLRYSTPHELKPDEALLNISVNGVPVASVPLLAGTNRDVRVALPQDLLTSDNALGFELTGRCADCYAGTEPVPWITFNLASSLEVSGTLLPLANDLNLLPAPFFDAAVKRAWSLPVVFSERPDSSTLEAAGVVASWFGKLSDFRGVRFPVQIGKLPMGNVILFASSQSDLAGVLGVKGLPKPAIVVRNNPVDTYGKVLVIVGDNSRGVLTAARALAGGHFGHGGDTALIETQNALLPGAAYSAPRWLKPNARSSLGEYTTAEQLTVYGSGSIDTYFRMPPDLHFSPNDMVRLSLRYQYSGVPRGSHSVLGVKLNGAYIGSIKLSPELNPNAVHRDGIGLPAQGLRPYSNTLSFEFVFDATNRASTGQAQFATIMRDSTIDLRGYSHLAVMPKLELFSEAGFPFTRHPDLSGTAVVMPTEPTASEVELYLGVMGYFGAQTGSPAMLVTVTSPWQIETVRDKDLLVIGNRGDQSLLQDWAASMPIVLTESGWRLGAAPAWWHLLSPEFPLKDSDRHQLDEVFGSEGGLDSVIFGFESPLKAGRSVVVLSPEDRDNVLALETMFLPGRRSGNVYGTVSVSQGGVFRSYHVGRTIYHVGQMKWYARISFWMAEFYWLVPVIALLCMMAVAKWLYYAVEALAARRLQARES